MEILKLGIFQLKELYKKKEVKPSEVVSLLLEEIYRRDKDIHSYLYINEKAIDQAKRVDEKIEKGEDLKELEGIPISIKDNICTKGIPTTCASKILENFIPPYDATVIERLKEKGAIIIGKTNMDEFAFGSSTENSAFGPTRNPHNLERVPGGSSGGSTASVASNLCFASLGSDTGGSIRQPSAFCGVVGIKPTYGRVSRYGLIAFASSLDQIGPITKNVKDNALLLKIISGKDKMDSTSVDIEVCDYLEFLNKDLGKLKIGIPKEYFVGGIDKEIREKIFEILKILEERGMIIEEISLPHTDYGIATYYIIATAEASSNLARFDGVKYGYRSKNYENLMEMYMKTRGEGFGEEVKRRIILGTYVLSSGYYEAYYLKAQKVRTLIKNDFEQAFKKVDIILTPTTPELPFKLGEKKDDPLKMYLSDIFTVNVNLTGLPAINIPCSFSSNKLPIGVQFISPYFKEEILLNLSYKLENELKGGDK
ncbi:MAG: Asp-tRNA(Asn)/Glu-tRNA(Gln) amidotransferase subunit GatA [Candidatus Omnitrophica bacterium]|nr:Asp-tRNA(Asn)/Glu-tRNA(Gln) amidotransferase subunit GatA [Candidatus Omnitrophota bacterium]MCM8802219.1 Asp-tRNA(Asn)/Glu-tRNA(Gln) amidotransferase subunit GatA [Candidatus Omnitrophota bacterium]